jgi:hypothetical protein
MKKETSASVIVGHKADDNLINLQLLNKLFTKNRGIYYSLQGEAGN